ncbi:putative holin-like toxin [Enterococcus sp. AZ194]
MFQFGMFTLLLVALMVTISKMNKK